MNIKCILLEKITYVFFSPGPGKRFKTDKYKSSVIAVSIYHKILPNFLIKLLMSDFGVIFTKSLPFKRKDDIYAITP